MPDTVTVNSIIDKFMKIYPLVEAMITGSDGQSNALYRQGLADIERLYDQWDITGAERARYVADYVSGSTKEMISGAIQASLGIVQQSHALTMQQSTTDAETEYKNTQTEALRNSESHNALIKVFQSMSEMMGAMGSGGIIATPALIAANRMAVFKLLELITKPNAEKIFSREDISYLESLVDKSSVTEIKLPDSMNMKDGEYYKNNINYK